MKKCNPSSVIGYSRLNETFEIVDIHFFPGFFNDVLNFVRPVDPVVEDGKTDDGIEDDVVADGPSTEEGLPAHKSTARCKKTPGRPANAAYRAKIAENVDNYRNTSNREEKLAVRMRVMEELTNEGYYFVSEKESTWTV